MKNLFTTLVALCAMVTLSTPVLAADDLVCYKGKDAVMIFADLTIVEPSLLGGSTSAVLQNAKLREVCVPADVTVNDLKVDGQPASEQGVTGPDLTAAYACYRLTRPVMGTVEVPHVLDRFADRDAKSIAQAPSKLCVPLAP